MSSFALWFANRCPYFDVLASEIFDKAYPGENISEKKLLSLGFELSARWFRKNESQWEDFLKKAAIELKELEARGGGCLFWGDPRYPYNLKNIYFPPSVLFFLGDLKALTPQSVAMVGARLPTFLGLRWVQTYVPDLIKANLAIVSGGARGIDFEAHHAALQSGGVTIAFLPGGVMNPYPSSNRYIFEKMVKSGGLLLSEFLTSDVVRKENFHRRNRLIAALGDIVVIVEAKLQSGTIMTANRAKDENKDVFVVPGHPFMENYAGSIKLLSDGAMMVAGSEELIAHLKKKCFEKNHRVF